MLKKHSARYRNFNKTGVTRRKREERYPKTVFSVSVRRFDTQGYRICRKAAAAGISVRGIFYGYRKEYRDVRGAVRCEIPL